MSKVAKLVSVHPQVRVVVDESATEEQILDAAMPKLVAALREGRLANVDEIRDDTECPIHPNHEHTTL